MADPPTRLQLLDLARELRVCIIYSPSLAAHAYPPNSPVGARCRCGKHALPDIRECDPPDHARESTDG